MKNKNGSSYVTTCIVILFIFMLFSVILTFAEAVQLTRLSQQSVKICLDSYVVENAQQIYSALKNGENTLESMDASSYTSRLVAFSGLEKRENMLYHTNEGRDIFWITVPVLEYSTDQKLSIYADFTAYIPLYFCGVEMDIAQVPIRVESQLTSIFN